MLAEFKMIGAGLATIALAGVGNGIGIISSQLLVAVARNPNVMRELLNYAISGLALCEAIASPTIMVVFPISPNQMRKHINVACKIDVFVPYITTL